MNKPFAGIRILDFTRYVAGQFGTYQFAFYTASLFALAGFVSLWFARQPARGTEDIGRIAARA